jgi:agarase
VHIEILAAAAGMVWGLGDSLGARASARGGRGEHDQFGGWERVKGRATGFFHLECIDGKWWFVTPEGNAFVSKGVCCIGWGDLSPSLGRNPYGELMEKTYGTREAWAPVAAERVRGWGFNTVGSWSAREMWGQGLPYTVILNLAASTTKDMWLKGLVPDVFAPEFAEAAQRRAAEVCGPMRNDPLLIGYYSDNEMRWDRDWRSQQTLLETCLEMPEGAPGRRAAEEVLGGSADRAGANAEFQRLYAQRYFSVCREAILKADPNHLVLGCRFAGYAPMAVIEAMKGQVAVVSWNNYDHRPPTEQLRQAAAATDCPVMITEFGFKAMDSGLPNTRGAGVPLATQQERADLLEKYVMELLATNFCVGYHWFQYVDQPKEGRFDGENSNFGLVSIGDRPWDVVVERVKAVNARAEEVHEGCW